MLKVHTVTLVNKIIEFATEDEIEMINEIVLPNLVHNLELDFGLHYDNIESELVIKSLKIIRALIDDFENPEEERLIKSLLEILSRKNVRENYKIEKYVIETIHILW